MEQELTCEERLEAVRAENVELREALHKAINFRTASDLRPQAIWLYAVDALNIRMAIRKEAEPSIENHRAYDKLIFTVGDDGRVTDVKRSQENKQT